jgi:hypothetical protein
MDDETIATHIDACILNNTHFDIANIVYKILSGKFRYTNNTWEYLKTEANADADAATATSATWETDENGVRFIYSIRTLVCRAFTSRSLYWANATASEASEASNADTRYPDTEVISMKLLSISSKLKDNKYICLLIKECKEFFLYEPHI